MGVGNGNFINSLKFNIMGKEMKSEGNCVYCDKMFTQAGMTKHLATHLLELEKKQKTTETAFHVKIEEGEMFLHLLVSGGALLSDLDGFLRAIWLECCGHMSSFKQKGKRYEIDYDDEDADFGEPMGELIANIFKEKMVLEYEYDFGSTTYLKIQVLKSYQVTMKEPVTLLSRNEPLAIMCGMCKTQPAVKICSIHLYETYAFYCKDCQKKHAKVCPDFKDYAAMPVVNSPRMGVCGYDGGHIDKKRDGVYKMPPSV
jgi:hypothetical protein